MSNKKITGIIWEILLTSVILIIIFTLMYFKG